MSGGASSRRKGHQWERDVAQRMRDIFGEAKRGLSQARGGTAEGADVEVPEDAALWIECKVGKRVNIVAALEQALRAIGTKRIASPVAICKQDRCDATATMFLGDWEDLVREWWTLRQQAAHLEAALEETVGSAAKRLPDVRTEPLPFEPLPIVDQPPPKSSEGAAIWPLVIADMQQRDALGRARYGTPLRAFNGRDALVDAYQEALDLAVYLRQALEERPRKMPQDASAASAIPGPPPVAENAAAGNVANLARDCDTCIDARKGDDYPRCVICSGGIVRTMWRARR